MQGFAIIKPQPLPHKRVSVSVHENIHSNILFSAIKQPQSNKGNTHIIDKRRRRQNSQADHVIEKSKAQVENIILEQENEEVIQVNAHNYQNTHKKKPIFNKSPHPPQDRPDEETISAISSIHLAESVQEMSEQSEIYFTSASHRKMKDGQLYASTYRTKQYLEKSKEKKKMESPVRQRKKLFRSKEKKHELELIEHSKDEDNTMTPMQEKRQKKAIFSKNKPAVEEQEKSLSSSQVRKLRPKASAKSIVSEKISSSELSFSVISRAPMQPFRL